DWSDILRGLLLPYTTRQVLDGVAGDCDARAGWLSQQAPIRIDQVIELSGFERVGEQMAGPHPAHGSTTGRNLAVDPSRGVWHCFRHGTGGDAWLLLAVLEGAVPCENARPGALVGEALKQTLKAALKRGLITEAKHKELVKGLGGSNTEQRGESTPKAEEKPEPEIEEYPQHIRERAQEIMKHGDPVQFILDVLSRFHVGDRQSAVVLLCSAVIGSCKNANGLQPKLSGASGKGKTHLCKALKHLMPPEWVKFTSLSPKAIYYDPDIKPGMVIFSDDVRISEDLEDTLKRAMSNFQEPAPYLTVNKLGKIEKRYLPERLTWWLTSVAFDQEEQLVNRLFEIGVDESREQDHRVLEMIFAPLIEGREEFPLTEEVMICRQILREIKSKIWLVRAPFLRDKEGKLRLEWQDLDDRRNPGRFADLLAAFAILRSAQRETFERDGYTVVTATEEDYYFARDVFGARAQNLSTKLSDRELHFLMWLHKRAGNQPFEFRINDVVSEYRGPDGRPLSPRTIDRMLSGRRERNQYGLEHKLRGGALMVEERMESVPNRSGEKITRKCKVWVFDPSRFNPLEAYNNTISLRGDGVEGNQQHAPLPHHVPSLSQGMGQGTNATTDIDFDIEEVFHVPHVPEGEGMLSWFVDLVGSDTLRTSLCVRGGASGASGAWKATDSELLGAGNGTGKPKSGTGDLPIANCLGQAMGQGSPLDRSGSGDTGLTEQQKRSTEPPDERALISELQRRGYVGMPRRSIDTAPSGGQWTCTCPEPVTVMPTAATPTATGRINGLAGGDKISDQIQDLLQDADEHGLTAWELSRKTNLPPGDVLQALKQLEADGLVLKRGRDPREPYDGEHWILACYGG
ncbi:MAG TPA: hypothetical protein PK659_10180, partial [Methanothrix sp.]|nr:hypothetical protein [Methanothrix sp.]